MTKDNTLLKNTAVLAVSGIIVKGLSAVYRIPLTRMLGAEGMGQYSAAFNIFMPFFAFCCAGITPTLSRLSARTKEEQKGEILYLQKKSGVYFGLLSFVMVCCRLAVAGVYSSHLSSPIMFWGVALMCPNLIFAAQEAVYKGISQGTFQMAVTARANILESALKVVLGISSVYFAGVKLKEYCPPAQLACAYATISICGLACLLYMRRDFKKRYADVKPVKTDAGLRIIFSMARPISASALVMAMSNFFDTVVCLSIVKGIPDRRLAAAYPYISFTARQEKAIWLFGVYQGLCLSVVNLIPSLSSAIGSAGLPVVTKSLRRENTHAAGRQTDKLIKLTAASVVPVSAFVAFFPYEVLSVLFGDKGSQTILAAEFLKIMAPVAVLSAFSFPLNSVLHALGKSSAIFKILLVCCIVKAAVGARLCSVDSINIMGCVYSAALFHIMVFIMSVGKIKKSGVRLKVLQRLAMPAAASYTLLTFIKIGSDRLLYTMPLFFRMFCCGALFVVLYGIILFLSGFFVDNISRR